MRRVWQTKNGRLRVWETKDPARIDRSVLHMENARVRLSVLPCDGGRLISLYDKQHDFEHIWTNERTRRLPRFYGANYDDLSASGLEEAFPTVQPCEIDGVTLPFFGEVWPIPWEYEIETDGDEAAIRLWCTTSITPAKLTKTFLLKGNEARLVTQYRVENLGAGSFPYLFGVHPSVCVTEDTRVIVPQARYRTGYLYPPDLTEQKEFAWPELSGKSLAKTYPFADNLCVNFYTDNVKDGSYGFYHNKEKCGINILFSPEDFKSLSIWLIYGGWRGHYCAMTEMFSCWPADLRQALERGIHETLQAGEAREYKVAYELTGEHAGKG